jgi:hypothetical protein
MKFLTLIIVLVLLPAAVPANAGDIPQAVAGFVLDQDIAGIHNRLQMDSVLPLRYQEYLQEVEIAPLSGFKSGLITYGTCARPGRIVRIKLKYLKSDRAFYEALLERVKDRFGAPTVYDGDPFHIVIEWKWSFVDADGRRITLHLSHNSRDTEEKFGNSVKLTLASAIDQERQCFRDRNSRQQPSKAEPRPPLNSMTEEDWKALMPQ